MKKLVLATVCITLVSCSSGPPQYGVTYDSTPQAAMLICNNKQEGYTPKTLYYTLNENNFKTGVLKTAPCRAVWASGMQAEFNDFFNLHEFPNRVQTSVSAPKIDNRDMQFALQKAQIDAQENHYRSMRAAQQSQQIDQMIQGIGNIVPKTTYCNRIGYQVMCNTY